MIDDILDLSRFEMTGFSLVPEAVPLKPLLTEAVEMVGELVRGRPVHVALTVADDLPIVEIDRTRIARLFSTC